MEVVSFKVTYWKVPVREIALDEVKQARNRQFKRSVDAHGSVNREVYVR